MTILTKTKWHDMDLSKKSQEQVAGDNSTQNQVVGQQVNTTYNTNVTLNGPTIPDVVAFSTTVSTQVTQQALSLCTQVASDIASSRMNDFASIWIPRIEKMEKAVENLKEPKFQFMLRDANITAAKSTRKEDLETLAELLACQIEKGHDIKKSAGINRAIQIVDQVDHDTLCGLAIIVTILDIYPISGDIRKGLIVLNDLYSKLIVDGLPATVDWIDNAIVVGTISMLSGKFYHIDKLMESRLNGYICAGIKSDSEAYQKAKEILISNGYSVNLLIENELLPGYFRLKTRDATTIKTELKPIVDLYSKDSNLINQAKQAFMTQWDSFESLKKIRVWFENLNVFFRINTTGIALAQTYAKRCYKEFPDLI